MNEIRLGNRVVGKINVFGAFETNRREDTHLFINFQGIGFNEKLMLQFPLDKEVWVFYLRKTGETTLLKTNIQKILIHGIEWQNGKDIADKQLILPLEKFEEC